MILKNINLVLLKKDYSSIVVFKLLNLLNILSHQSGADINAKDMLKMTALHWAAQHGHHRVAEMLLKHGADAHALSKFDKTPFDIAVDIQNADLILMLQVCHRKPDLKV